MKYILYALLPIVFLNTDTIKNVKKLIKENSSAHEEYIFKRKLNNETNYKRY